MKPLESACWCYLLLTILPGILVYSNSYWLMDAIIRYILPGALAVLLAIRFYGGEGKNLGMQGFFRSILHCAPIAVLCVVNVLVGEFSGFPSAGNLVLILFGAAGEELLARFMLLLGICAGARDRDWGGTMTIVVAGVIFGLMHAINFLSQGMIGTIFQCCYTAVIGGLFAWSYRKTGCIWGGVLWHFLLNLTATMFP